MNYRNYKMKDANKHYPGGPSILKKAFLSASCPMASTWSAIGSVGICRSRAKPWLPASKSIRVLPAANSWSMLLNFHRRIRFVDGQTINRTRHFLSSDNDRVFEERRESRPRLANWLELVDNGYPNPKAYQVELPCNSVAGSLRRAVVGVVKGKPPTPPMRGMCRRWRVLTCIPDNASGDKRVQDLRQTDPRDDRFEILARKNPLLRGLCLWVHDDIAFPRWRSGNDIRILWLHRARERGRRWLWPRLSMKYPRGCTARPTQPVYYISSARARIATATRPLRFFEVWSTSRWTSSQDCVETFKRGTTIPGQAVHAN